MERGHGERVFWGVFWIACGIFLLVSKLWDFGHIGLFSILLTVFFVACIVKCIARRDIAGMLFPIAFLGIIYDDFLGIEAITPGPILGAALLGTIGISMIYHPRHYGSHHHIENGEYNEYHTSFDEDVSNVEGNDLRFETRFSSSCKFVKSNNFKKAQISTEFGATKVYFDNAIIQEGEAQIEIYASFGGVELFIPKSWKIVDKLGMTFGGVDEKNRPETTGTPVVTLVGNCSFAGVTITYI